MRAPARPSPLGIAPGKCFAMRSPVKRRRRQPWPGVATRRREDKIQPLEQVRKARAVSAVAPPCGEKPRLAIVRPGDQARDEARRIPEKGGQDDRNRQGTRTAQRDSGQDRADGIPLCTAPRSVPDPPVAFVSPAETFEQAWLVPDSQRRCVDFRTPVPARERTRIANWLRANGLSCRAGVARSMHVTALHDPTVSGE